MLIKCLLLTAIFLSCASVSHPPKRLHLYDPAVEKLTQDIVELGRLLETFPEYEKRRAIEKLEAARSYILEQLIKRIDKHPVGREI